MARSIPIGKRWAIGGGIVGLFPGVGDLAGSFVSALIVASAFQAGLPRAAITDTMLGGIPLISLSSPFCLLALMAVPLAAIIYHLFRLLQR
jgi:hypothetical protein